MDADYFLGRVYRMALYQGNSIVGFLNVTVAGVEERRVRLHGEDGSKAWITAREFDALLKGGQLEDSDGAPTIWG